MWIRPQSGNGTVFAKQDTSDFIYYGLELIDYSPTVIVNGYDLTNYQQRSLKSTFELKDSEWQTAGYSL